MDDIQFFTKEELNFFYNWRYKVYDKFNHEHIAAKNFLLDTVWSKTAYWAEKLHTVLPEYDIINRRMWSQAGWDDAHDKKTQVARFKPYTWARIFKRNDDNKDIFFSVGIDAELKSLVYKIDFFEEASSLTEEQKSLCAQLIPEDLKFIEISYEQIDNYNWTLLLKITEKFIKDNSPVYDRIIAAVWENEVPADILRDKLILRNKPTSGIDRLPDLNPLFQGVDRDYLNEHEQRITIGTFGEELVLAYERKKLNDLKRSDLAKKVEKVKDGCGYDIRSYNKDGNEKHIEVKTSTNGINTTFEMSFNEWSYMKKFPDNYFIYRLFNYSLAENVAEFYILENPKDELLFQATNFRAHIKK